MPSSRTTLRIVLTSALAGLTVVVASCDEGPVAPPASPSSAFPSETIDAPMPTLPTPAPAAAGAPTGDLTSGTARLQTSGDLQLEAELPILISAIGAAPPGGFALVWTGEGDDATTVGLGGSSFVGVRPTSPTLVLTIAAPTDAGVSTWVSTAGECEIELDVARSNRFSGSFACDDLRSPSGEVVSASGTFEAAG